ncbi:MAG TPA: hypothetical protein V6D11_08880, partial [Waterburya sp.]
GLRALSLVFTRFAGFTPVLFLLCQPFVSKDESLVNKDEFRQQYQFWGNKILLPQTWGVGGAFLTDCA